MAMNALEKLGSLPGMTEVKLQVEQILQFKKISKLRKGFGLKTHYQTNHMLFLGNPGTGKTTAARLIGQAFSEIGILKSSPANPRDNRQSQKIPFVEVHHADITSEYVGVAERNIKKKFNQAKGGVLFMDEAYSFLGDESSSGKAEKKTVAAIVQLMEDFREEVIVIAAGYPKEMEEFLNSNPGLRSRFSSTIHFPDYSVPDMVWIAQTMLNEQEYQATQDYFSVLANQLWLEKGKKDFGNACTVRNIVERSIRSHAVRVAQLQAPTKSDLSTLVGADISSHSNVKVSEKQILQKALLEIQERLLTLELQEITFRSKTY